MKTQKKLRKQAIKKLMADGCPEDLARLMPKTNTKYEEPYFIDWFAWHSTEQGDLFWIEINDKKYDKAREILLNSGLEPWSKKSKAAKAKAEFEMMTEEQKKGTIVGALFGNKSCRMTLINYVKRVPVAINKESKNG